MPDNIQLGKPLVFADAPFDEDRIDEIEFRQQEWDGAYVGGYSEKKRENAHRVREGEEPLPIDRLAWVRVSSVDGSGVAPSDDQMINWRQLGYRAVGTDYLKDQGYDFPPTAHVDAQGLIRRNDTALFMVPARLAEVNRKQGRGRHVSKTVKDLESEDGLELYQNERKVQEKTNPKEVWDSGLPKL